MITDVTAWKTALPTPQHEDWKYTSLASLKKAELRPEQVRPTITATGATVTWHENEHEHVVVNVVANATVTIVHDTPAGALTDVRIRVVVPPGATASIVETFSGNGVSAHVPALSLDVGTGAAVQHVRIVDAGRDGFHLGDVRADVAQDGTYALQSVVLGGRIARVALDVKLAQGATTALDGLSLAGRDALVDHHTFVDHTEPAAVTRERFRAAVGSGGRAVFTGRIVVRPGASKTDASQHTKTLLLADDAVANARPQLEIGNDDVKCAHGAAVGRLDDEALFYLQTRGLDAGEARRLLVRAFASQSLEAIADETLRAEVDARVVAWLDTLEVA